MYPEAFNRDELDGVVPSSQVLNYMSRLREEPESEDESSADEGVPPKGSGWCGRGEPMVVGVGYVSRELCDGQTLASPGRWPVAQRRYPESTLWLTLAGKFMDYAHRFGTPELLMKLALGRVESCPFELKSINKLKAETLVILAEHGLSLERKPGARADVPIDYRYMGLLLKAAEDPEVGMGDFATGVRVGPARLPRIPALYPRKKKWRLPRQADPLDYLEDQDGSESVWRQNYSSVGELADQVLEVMIDQANRGQVLRLSEVEARRRFPGLVVASLGAMR